MSDKRLLPCPFCGVEAELACRDFGGWFVRCKKCFCKTPIFLTERFATISWNTRKPMKKIVERLEEKAEECRKYWEEFDDEDSFGAMNAYCDAVKIVKEEGGMSG